MDYSFFFSILKFFFKFCSMLLLAVYMSALTYWSSYFFIFLCFFYAARIGYTFGCHCYPTILDSLGHCRCVHQGKISTAAGFEPGTPVLWVNHATNELSLRHGCMNYIIFFINVMDYIIFVIIVIVQ